MYELKVKVSKVLGACTANPPMKPGDFFTVSDGDLQIPDGGFICLWALQSLLPLITPKEREISEHPDEDWMWRVHHAQCPDPKGRVIFKLERTGKLDRRNGSEPETPPTTDGEAELCAEGPPGQGLKALRIRVESAGGRCTSRMKPGDYFTLRDGRLYLPSGRHICLYALHAALPLLPAKQRALREGDWLKDDCRVICPDPAGNVILRIEVLEGEENDPV